ncbi:MAG: GNAT family N-acetyltransferase [Anaerolineae bacterium]|nr:GNAT family N-acetyltransferase [Anaerolineae bacterium]
MIELTSQQFPLARAIFTGEHSLLVVDGMIAGHCLGRIWVDDLTRPTCALAWDEKASYLLGGDPAAAVGLHEAFTAAIHPEIQRRGIPVIKVSGSGEGWQEAVRAIFAPYPFNEYPRVFYRPGRWLCPDWRERMPEGYRMALIDADLLSQAGLRNMGGLVEEIEECWPSVAHFIQHGFGTCILSGDEIVCRCTAEYRSPGKVGIGILTEENQQKRGLATLAASAFVEISQQRGLAPHWDAWKNNVPSVRAAEKTGFALLEDYTALLWFQN